MIQITLPQQLSRRDLSRHRAYQENLDFYEGTQWLGNARRRERRLTFNYAKTFIDKMTSYLMSSISFSVEPVGDSVEATERARRAGDALHLVYETNNLEQLDFDTEIDTAVLGDGCFKVTWDNIKGQARVSSPDVKGLFAWWQGDDITRVWKVASRYQLSPEEAGLLYGFKPTINSQRPVMVTEVWTDSEIEIWLDDTLCQSGDGLPLPVGPSYLIIPLAVF